MKNSNNRGFTLIELLVVISIIGLLSSVVLASLNTARGKADVAAGKTFASHTRAALYDNAVIYFDFDDANALPSVTANKGTFGGTMSLPASEGLSIIDDTDLYKRGKQFSVANSASLAGVGTYLNDLRIGNAVGSRDYTLTAWYKQASSPVSSSLVVGIGDNPNMLLTSIIAGNGVIYGKVHISGITYVDTSTATIKPDKWYHLALVVTPVATDQIKMDLYLNGKLSGTLTTGSINMVAKSFFGIGGNCCNFRAFGSIDDTALYSKSLLSSEIQQIYAAGLPTHTLAEK